MNNGYLLFLGKNFKPVFFGWLTKLFSSFGQTFLISLYVPFIISDFGFSHGFFGALYSAATLCASFFLFRLGHVIDHSPVRNFTLRVIFLLAGASILLGIAAAPVFVFIAMVFLRLAGQSLLPHVGSTVMTRYFNADRGKALSLSALGFSAGEIVFPLVLGPMIAFAGWRLTAASSGILLPIVLVPILNRLSLEKLDTVTGGEDSGRESKKKTTLPVSEIISRSRFWIIGSPTAFLSFTVTGYFFYQYMLAAERGWSLQWYATCFAGFGVAKLLSSLLGGIFVDRFSARRLFPFFPLPAALGFLVPALTDKLFAPLIFLALLGTAIGLSGVVTAAVKGELYRLKNIARVRSVFTVLMVVSASLGPLAYGFLLDAGISFEFIARVNVFCLLLLFLSGLLIGRQVPD